MYKLFIMKTGARCALTLEGFKKDVDAVAHLVRIAMIEEDTPDRRKAFLDAVANAVQHMEDPLPPFCDGCGQEIDPETCHCGSAIGGDREYHGHDQVPMGCRCLYDRMDWEAVARGLRERLRAERARRTGR